MESIQLNESDDQETLLGTLLRVPYRALMDIVETGLVAAGYADVRATHFPVLQPLLLRPKGMWASELAANARMTKPSIGYLIEHLEQHGYVERVPDPLDGRAQLVRLTPRGWELGKTTRRLVRHAEAQWAELIGKEQVEELRQRLQALVAALEHDIRVRE